MANRASTRLDARSRTFPDRMAMRSLYAVLLSWAAVLILHEIPVGGHWLPIAMTTWALVLSWPLIFALCFVVTVRLVSDRKPGVALEDTAKSANFAVFLLIAISAFGAALVVFDFAILREYGFGMAAAEIRSIEEREALQGIGSSSPISGAGRLMLPAVLPGGILAAVYFKHLPYQTKVFCAACLVLFLYEQVAFEGGRLMIAALALSILTAYLIGRAGNSPTEKRAAKGYPWMRIALAGLIIFYFFLSVFLDRVFARDDFFWTAYARFSADFQIIVDTDVIARFEGVSGGFFFAISMLWLYITQGINELDYLLLYDNIPNSSGLYQFPQVAPIAEILFDEQISYDFLRILPNVGTYLTMYGANYLDFGHRGAILSAALYGSVTGLAMLRFAQFRFDGLGLAGPMLISLALLSPVLSLITNIWPGLIWAVFAGIVMRSQGRRFTVSATA